MLRIFPYFRKNWQELCYPVCSSSFSAEVVAWEEIGFTTNLKDHRSTPLERDKAKATASYCRGEVFLLAIGRGSVALIARAASAGIKEM